MRFRVLSIVFLALTIAGCGYVMGPVKEVEAYGAAVTPFMEELTKAVAADRSEAGIDKAAKLWESKKADLQAKRDAINAAPKGMNADWMSLLFKINGRTQESLNNIESSVIGGGYESPGHLKFRQLQKDIETTLKLK